MSDSDAETIWMSRIDMNIPNTMMMNATTRLGSIRSESTGAAPVIAGLAVVALAMAVSVQCTFQNQFRCLFSSPRKREGVHFRCGASALPNLLRLNHAGRVEIGFVVRILGALVGVDGGVDRH